MNLGSFIMKKLALVDTIDVDWLANDVAVLYIASPASIGTIVAQRNAANEGNTELSPVVPRPLTQ